MRNPRATRHARSRPASDVRTVYGRMLRSPDRHTRLRALEELEYLNCERELSVATKQAIVGWCLQDYHGKNLGERRAIARFLDAWLDSQPDRVLARRLAAARMEEVDPAIRDGLLPASFAVLPTSELIDQLATPPTVLLRDGYGLLVALDALHMRLRNDDLDHDTLDAAIAALRTARSVRNTPVVKPFLWQVEVVLERACERRGIPVPGGLRDLG